MNEKKKPEGYENVLGEYAVVYRDSSCAEPILWGWLITQRMEEAQFKVMQATLKVVCIAGPTKDGKPGLWAVIDLQLSEAAAIEKYGPVTKRETGPRGGWVATTFGTTRFQSRYMKPEGK